MATSDPSTKAMPEERFNYKCTALCWKNNLITEAFGACFNCKKYFCISCMEDHDNMFGNHITVEPSILFLLHPTEFLPEQCKKHDGKMIDVWCIQHDALGCVRCSFFEHRSCKGVKNISSEIKDIFKQEEIDSTKTDLKCSIGHLKDRQRFLNGEKENLFIEKNKQLSKIEMFARNLISLIEDLVRKTKDEIFSKFKEIEDDIQKVADECKHHEANIRQCMEQFESCIGNEPQMFITMKNAQQTIALMNRSCRDPVIRDCTIAFKQDSSIEEYLTDLLSLGTSSKVPRKYKLINEKEINVKLNFESKDCNIEGSCLLPDGSVVVADYNNEKLKHVDISFSLVIDSCVVPGEPYGVCCVGQQELAVALWEKKIQFVTLGRRMTLSRTFGVDHYCYGIACHNGELFISDLSKTVFVYNMQGSLLSKLTNITTSYCRHMTVSRDGEKVFSACSTGGLKCTDRHGNPIYTYTDKNIDYCHGVCLDHRSSLFVCGYRSHSVVQVSESGKKVGRIVKKSDGVYHPKSLCFDPMRQRLVVAQQSRNKVVVIELKLN